MSKKKHSKIDEGYNGLLMYLPLIIASSVIPLIVRIYLIDYPIDNIPWFQSDSSILDIYSFSKSRVIVAMGFISLLFIFYKIIIEQMKFFKDPIVLTSLSMLSIIVISSILSPYKYTSFNGYIERYEGLFVNLSYVLLFLLAYKLPWKQINLKVFFKWFAFSNIILSLIGLGQYFGFDILLNDSFISFVTSFSLSDVKLDSNAMTNYKVIGQTLYHYNYVSFFTTMSFPFFISSALYSDSNKTRILYGSSALLVLFNLLGSSARSGMFGLAVGIPFWIFFNRHKLLKNLKIFSIIIGLMLIIFVGFETLSGGFVTTRIKSTFNTPKNINPIQKVYTEDKSIIVELVDHIFTVKTSEVQADIVNFEYTLDGLSINHLIVGDAANVEFNHQALQKVQLKLQAFDDGQLSYTLITDDLKWHFTYQNDHLVLYNIYGNYEDIEKFETLGFYGYERLGSARGYIWSRTFPLILDKPLLGYGPDTFPLVFPQHDYIGKQYAYSTPNMIIDKAHNFPIQQAVSFGIPYLLAILLLILLFFIRSMQILSKQKFKFTDEYQSTFFTFMVSFLIASMFNDSSVHVSPVFWTLFGISLHYYTKDNQDKIKL